MIINQQTVLEALDLLASAYQVAQRKGDCTNWEALSSSLLAVLHKTGRNGVTPRTYRLVAPRHEEKPT